MTDHARPPLSVLFVCLGNICRSPMVEGAFRAAAENAGIEARVDSVGTAAYHIGEPPDSRAIATAMAHGVDIAALRGRQLQPQDFYEFTHIFALDTANLAGVKAQEPRDASANVSLLMDAVEGRSGEPVPDPYYGDESDFQAVWAEIQTAVAALVKAFEESGAEARF
ncbi:low molecular weight phosphotyrosine protein phosphatase [Erythrobacter insulae]|uniref:protein-tyrosine-phosphatase n=1 Tax=Erythrobacter insulae TaxID=2584124 RepID=A0A547P7A3_9SPHN|nr:low molecular weight protein-tyrosine-phosphatase [Erythrobacter insulae]TRD10015.1 low molecular weight phosphotyrosine protein phosphatase [Erythrobacter insulae]